MARGRKPKKIDLSLVEKYAALGMTYAQIAAALGICRDTLYERIKANPDISDALQRGEATGVRIAAERLMAQIAAGDAGCIRFYLERRGGWHATSVVRPSNLDIENMTAAEIREHLAEALRQRP